MRNGGMRKRIGRFAAGLSGLLLLLAAETGWFSATKGTDEGSLAIKRGFVALTGLPDLSVATEARFIRFRSLADIYSPFNEGPELLDYFPASFTYAPSVTQTRVPSRIELP